MVVNNMWGCYCAACELLFSILIHHDGCSNCN